MSYDVFISYRRKTGADDARLLQQALIARGYNVFFDYDSLRDGKFDERILMAIEESQVFVLMLSEAALDNCADKDDWVRLEIEHALKCNCKIVPVAQVPKSWSFPSTLPQALVPITKEQISEFNKMALFDESIDRIVRDRFPPSLQVGSRHDKRSVIRGDEAFTSETSTSQKEGESLLCGRYRILRQCGLGDTGTVLLSEDTLLDDKKVAIKFVPEEVVEGCYFKREFIPLVKKTMINHPNIATCRSVEKTADGRVFIVIDYIDGVMLRDYVHIKRRCLTEDEIQELFGPVADAIDYIHKMGITHGDLKPQTILIAKDDIPYVIDLGLSRLTRELQTMASGRVFDVAGTLSYRSPEEFRECRPTAKSDVYSFALIVYECLTGSHYYPPEMLMPVVRNKDESRLKKSKILPSLLKGLSTNPELRPSSCRAVLGIDAAVGKNAREDGRRNGCPNRFGLHYLWEVIGGAIKHVFNRGGEKHDKRLYNCIGCPELEFWALRDPDDWFSHDIRISCRAANGRNIVDRMSSGCLGERVSVPGWCPRRNALA